jgi:hypothetical protein
VYQSKTKYISQLRNQRALNIFSRNGFSVRLFGGEDSPMFILEDKVLLSCFVNGHNLHFLARPGSGEIIRSVKLTGDEYLTKYEISELIEKSEHLPVFRIRENCSGMWLVGFNYFESENEGISRERYPVFANHKPHIYIDQDRADSTYKELQSAGYNVKVQ